MARYKLALCCAAAIAAIAGAVLTRRWTASPDKFYLGATLATLPDESRRVLEDGTMVELNADTLVTANFTPKERRVQLDRGEANFTVAKDPLRPFIVSVHGIDVCAVGTMFNVRLDNTAVEILVTEGRVQVKTPDSPPRSSADLRGSTGQSPRISTLQAQQRAVVFFNRLAEEPQIATLTNGEIGRVLAWQHQPFDFTAAPLSEIVAEFNRRNNTQMEIADGKLAAVRISGTFRSDNLEGFLQLLQHGLGVQIERHDKGPIVLSNPH